MPNGPIFVAEYWSGWFDYWSGDHARVDVEQVTSTTQIIFDLGGSINYYMFHGGTSWGYMAGANFFGNGYHPDVTSYDYAAPLTETGDVTPLYYAIRETIFKYLTEEEKKALPPVPTNIPRRSYGDVYPEESASLLPQINVVYHKIIKVSSIPYF